MIYLVAMHRAHPGCEGVLKQSLVALIAPTRAEAGCIRYELHEARGHPGRFLFYEVWETQAHLDAHAASAHLAAYNETSRDWIAATELLPLDFVA
ncbi:antibiotic biosynthesis monooxygenase [Rhodobacteraceae bacterium]|nr:antibiotic biosynthesis monooxygenase [Paracoccaceae bacterium]